jgi:hypothetical protein
MPSAPASAAACSQKAKYKACEFGACPRTLCEKQTVLPVGLSDSVSLSGDNAMKLFCARCRELYDHNVPGGNYIDGAFFGSTFPHLFLQTYGDLRPARCTRQYIPRVFGFKVHQVRPDGRATTAAPRCVVLLCGTSRAERPARLVGGPRVRVLHTRWDIRVT